MNARLLTQVAPENRLLTRLPRVAAEATEAFVAVSFLTEGGAKLLVDALKPMLMKDRKIRIYCSGYMRVTHPEALRRLVALAKTFPRLELLFNGENQFHAKFMLFKTKNAGFTVFVGSSNLSTGGLLEAGEVNAVVAGRRSALFFRDAQVVEQNISKMPSFEPLTPTAIEAYARSFVQTPKRPKDVKSGKRPPGPIAPPLLVVPIYVAQEFFEPEEEQAIRGAKPTWKHFLNWDSAFQKLAHNGTFIQIDRTDRRKPKFAIQRYLEHDRIKGVGTVVHVTRGKFCPLSKLVAWTGKSQSALFGAKPLDVVGWAILRKRFPKLFA